VWTPSLDPYRVVEKNVRGLNAAARCVTVYDFLSATSCQLACLQETKLANIDDTLAASLGGYKLNS
jgi:exonuclease III